MKLNINEIEFDITIEYKKNKRTYLHVQGNHNLKITTNPLVTQSQIEAFILSKSNWIIEKDIQITNHYKTLDVCNQNDLILFGQKVKYSVLLGKNNTAYLKDNQLIVIVKKIENTLIQNTIYAYGQKQLEKYINQTRIKWDMIIDINYHLSQPMIQVKKLKGKWGVCYANKNQIYLSTALMHYPYPTIDAVLWHEYVHLIIPNHSKRYYQVLYLHMPEYDKYHQALKY